MLVKTCRKCMTEWWVLRAKKLILPWTPYLRCKTISHQWRINLWIKLKAHSSTTLQSTSRFVIGTSCVMPWANLLAKLSRGISCRPTSKSLRRQSRTTCSLCMTTTTIWAIKLKLRTKSNKRAKYFMENSVSHKSLTMLRVPTGPRRLTKSARRAWCETKPLSARLCKLLVISLSRAATAMINICPILTKCLDYPSLTTTSESSISWTPTTLTASQ